MSNGKTAAVDATAFAPPIGAPWAAQQGAASSTDTRPLRAQFPPPGDPGPVAPGPMSPSENQDGPIRSGPTGGGRGRSRRAQAAVIGGIVAIVLIIVAFFGAPRFGGQPAQRGEQPPRELLRVPRDPVRRYTVDGSETDYVGGSSVVGSTSRVALSMSGEPSELRVFGDDGSELWRREIEFRFETIETEGAYLLVEDRDDIGRSKRQAELVDAVTGEQLWSTQLIAHNQLELVGDELYVADHDQIAVYSLSDGEQLAMRQVDRVDTVDFSSAVRKGVVVWEGGDLQVLGDRLQPIGAPIRVDGYAFGSHQDGLTLVAQNGELTRYGTDGEKQATAPFDVNWLVPVEGTTWLYGNLDECGELEFSGESVEVRWSVDACEFWDLARLSDGKSYAVLGASTKQEWWYLDVASGTVLKSSEGFLDLKADGVIAFDGQDGVQGFALDGVTEVFSWVPEGEYEYLYPLDGGFAVIDHDQTTLSFTVYG